MFLDYRTKKIICSLNTCMLCENSVYKEYNNKYNRNSCLLLFCLLVLINIIVYNLNVLILTDN